jgi:DNA-binding IclR family transcriptional regulator
MMEMTPNNSSEFGKTIKSVERAFSIIQCLRESGRMTVSEVSEACDLPTSTAHLHLKTLASIGYVVTNEDGYRLSLLFLRDGIELRQRHRIYSISKDEVNELAATTGEVANLGIEEDGQRVLLYQSEGEEAVYDNTSTGEHTNMHWTALGKVILAHFPADYAQEIIDTHGLPAQTEQTITDPDELKTELRRIREQGYALEDEERRVGIRSVAVPIIVDENVVGSLSLTGPKNRFTDQRVEEEFSTLLQEITNIVEVKYEYN